MTDSRAAENTGDAENSAEAATESRPAASNAEALAPGTASGPIGGGRAKAAPKVPAGVRLTLWILLFGYCVFGFGYELSRPEPRLWVFVLRGVIGIIAIVNGVGTYNEIRNRRRT